MKKILVLTSGGDSSGMNAYIKALAKLCKKNKIALFASFNGYQGLIDGNIQKLCFEDMAEIENLGGSIIKVSRSTEFATEAGFQKALKTIKKHKLDAVIVVGGNGSFKGAERLSKSGVNIIAIPGTIDNDLFYTDKTLGYDTACNNALDAIVKIKQTMSACSRGCVIEVMGRNCPDISIFSAILSDADLLIAQKTELKDILSDVKKLIKNGVESPVVVVQENILDCGELADYLQQNTGKTFKANVLGYLQRGGTPTSTEKLFAIELACETVRDVLAEKYAVALGIREDKIFSQNLSKALAEKPRTSGRLQGIYDFYNKKI